MYLIIFNNREIFFLALQWHNFCWKRTCVQKVMKGWRLVTADSICRQCFDRIIRSYLTIVRYDRMIRSKRIVSKHWNLIERCNTTKDASCSHLNFLSLTHSQYQAIQRVDLSFVVQLRVSSDPLSPKVNASIDAETPVIWRRHCDFVIVGYWSWNLIPGPEPLSKTIQFNSIQKEYTALAY